MQKILDPDFNNILSEYTEQSKNQTEPISHYADGELEAEWLISAGLQHLIKPFEKGLEVNSQDLESVLVTLPRSHANAVKQRVAILNRTVKKRSKINNKRKPDIRDVFPPDLDNCSTGTRSRSATPDSLDSAHGNESWNTNNQSTSNVPSFVQVFHTKDPSITGTQSIPININRNSNAAHATTNNVNNNANVQQDQNYLLQQPKQYKLKRTPSAPLRGSAELFRGAHVRCDIPFQSADGIELLGFNKIGTLHITRSRSGSDPSCESLGRHEGANTILALSCSHENLLNPPSPTEPSSSSLPSSIAHSNSINNNNNDNESNILNEIDRKEKPSSRKNDSISFEKMFLDSEHNMSNAFGTTGNSLLYPFNDEPCVDVDNLTEIELKNLQPLLWLELAALFDTHQVILDKRKPFKRRRKEEGNLFAVSLNALIRRDQQITGEDSTMVPLFLQGVLNELQKRGMNEEGILRVAGHKQKTEILYNELEGIFYQKPEKVGTLLSSANVHDLSALLKRWIRELPQPLLASNLIQLYYQANNISLPDQYRALSIICLLLPMENRNTLRELLKFLNKVIESQESNKMTRNNVATIMAPSFFPPRFIHPMDKSNIEEQVKIAAQCCHLTNTLIVCGESLFKVPKRLVEQSKLNKTKQNRKVPRRLGGDEKSVVVDIKVNTNFDALPIMGLGGSTSVVGATTVTSIGTPSRAGGTTVGVATTSPKPESPNTVHVQRILL